MGRKTSRRHALGQHFLHNPRVLDRIVRTIAPQEGDLIIEVGAGEGALTFRLAKTAARIIALEKDPRLLPGLESHAYPNLTIRQADILAADLDLLIGNRTARLVGNLPYSLSSPILFKLLREGEKVSRGHFLVQKEFAARLTAEPGNRRYAPLSILIQNAFRVTRDFFVAPGSFRPPPRVDSAFITLDRRDRPLIDGVDADKFRRFLFAAFSQRRKKLTNNLRELSGIDPEAGLRRAGIDGGLRPEALSIPEFGRLFRALYPDSGAADIPRGK